jgi:hypothetical protein
VRVDFLPEQPGAALGGRQQTGQHLHGGGLAAAVAAQKAENLAAADAKADPVDGGEVAKAHGEIARLDGRLAVAVRRQRWNLHRPVAAAFFFWQQGDERRLERVAAGARQQLRRCAGGQHAPGVHGDQVVEARGLFHIGGRHQHAHVRQIRPDARDQLPELAPRQRIDAGGGFVQDQQVRVVDERAAQAELLLHAAGQLAGRPVQKREQAGGARQHFDAPCPLVAVVAEQAGEEVEVLGDRQRRVEVLAETLRHVGDARQDAPALAGVGQIDAEHLDAALLDGACAGHQRQQARLADAVRADQADHAAGRQVERHVGERGHLAVAQANALQARYRGARRRRGGGAWLAHGGSLTVSVSGQVALRSTRT